MMGIFKKPILSFSAIAAVAVCAVFLINVKPFAEQKRPERGSINFGSQDKPNVNIPPALQSFSTVFADVAEKVVPTVVSVIPTKIDTVTFTNNPFYQFFNDPFFGNPFEDFFGGSRQQQRRAPQQPQPQQQPQTRRRQGMGSGVIVSRDGHILTNSHVVQGADEIEVKMSDGRSFEAYVVGSDSLSDVAVIKIKDNVRNLPVAFLGDSDKLRPGDWAVAIGNPFSLTSSVTMGIVSATGRTTPGNASSFQNFIQTDAAINPGNSGGALVNIKGELIGINTMIYTQSGGNMGIGFAIPVNMARRIMEDLIYDGKVSRGWLGVSIQELDQSTRDAFGLKPETKGVLIGDVFKDQPACKAGIKRGDVVTKIDGKTIETINQLRNQVAALRPGQTAPVEVLRNNKKMTVQVRVTSRDDSQTARASADGSAESTPDNTSDVSKLLGMSVGAITPELRDQLKLAKNVQGVAVTEIARSGIAAREGLRQNDIILEVNRKSVSSVKDFNQALKGIKEGDSVMFLVQRDGNTFFRAFRVRN